mmetsp:Transcript_70207/g.121578  ORF Transcript_70207/g.121578 Transcript_70207/m.121578 type:complete len:845 (+) Transcript_70207:130-2664(+)
MEAMRIPVTPFGHPGLAHQLSNIKTPPESPAFAGHPAQQTPPGSPAHRRPQQPRSARPSLHSSPPPARPGAPTGTLRFVGGPGPGQNLNGSFKSMAQQQAAQQQAAQQQAAQQQAAQQQAAQQAAQRQTTAPLTPAAAAGSAETGAGGRPEEASPQASQQVCKVRHERCDDPSKPTCLRPRPDQNVLPLKAVRAEPREEVFLLRTEHKPSPVGGPDEVWARVGCSKGEGWLKTMHLKDNNGALSQSASNAAASSALGPQKQSFAAGAPMDQLTRTLTGMPSGAAAPGIASPLGTQTSGPPVAYTSSMPPGMSHAAPTSPPGPPITAPTVTSTAPPGPGGSASASLSAAAANTSMPAVPPNAMTPPVPNQGAPASVAIVQPPATSQSPPSTATQWVWPTAHAPPLCQWALAQQGPTSAPVLSPAMNPPGGDAPPQPGPLSPAARVFPTRADSDDFERRSVASLPSGRLQASAMSVARRDCPMAADSEDMESRSTAGCFITARDAFGRDLEEVNRKVQAVSLGSSCGTKLSLRRLGLGEATMPFDWMRTRSTGLAHWIRNNFDGFFETQQRLEVIMQDTLMTVYRSPSHSFWHDDIQDEVCHQKLQRRIDRFFDLVKEKAESPRRPLLFVRSVAGSSELFKAEELYETLCERFEACGRTVFLLLIVEDQPMLGPILHSKYDNLVFWVQPMFEGRLSTSVQVPSPYEDAIAFMVRRILGERGGLYLGEPEETWPTVSQASDILQAGSTFRNAGFKDTEVGLWVGRLRIAGCGPEEVLFSAFTGIDGVEESAAQPQVQAGLQPRLDSGSRAASFTTGRESMNRAKVLMVGGGGHRAFTTQPNMVVSAY